MATLASTAKERKTEAFCQALDDATGAVVALTRAAAQVHDRLRVMAAVAV